MRGTFNRWTRHLQDGHIEANLPGHSPWSLETDPTHEHVVLEFGGHTYTLTPDEARMIGVRLIEAAALVDEPNPTTVQDRQP